MLAYEVKKMNQKTIYLAIFLIIIATSGPPAIIAQQEWRQPIKTDNAYRLLLRSGHPSISMLLKSLGRSIAYSDYSTDFTRTKTGDAEYRQVVGRFFGASTGSAPGGVTSPNLGLPVAPNPSAAIFSVCYPKA